MKLQQHIAALVLTAWAGVSVAQPDADTLFAEANALVRAGLDYAALERYRDAAALGLDSPLFHYNMGILQHRLDNDDAAVTALERARAEPALAALADYNLGLVHLAAGRQAAARDAFTRVVDAAGHRELRRLAQRALTPASDDAAEPGAPDARSRPRLFGERRRAGDLSIEVSAAFGQVDNANRSPEGAYVDPAQPGQPVVVPLPVSSAYTPVDVAAEYRFRNEIADTEFFFRYDFNGEYYDEEAQDELSQRIAVGADIEFDSEAPVERRLHSAFFASRREVVNFDPDTGLERELNGVPIGQLFASRGSGIESEYTQRHGHWLWGVDLQIQQLQYDWTPLVEDYDLEHYFVRATAAYQVLPNMTLRFGLRTYRHDYEERRARDPDGQLLEANDVLRYDYQGIEAGFSHDFGRRLQLHFDYRLIDRQDAFAGYYDYTQHVTRIGLDFAPVPQMRITSSVEARAYDYPNAFAFHDPASGSRELDGLFANLELEYGFGAGLAVWARLGSEDVTSTDIRAEYYRTLMALGVRWRY